MHLASIHTSEYCSLLANFGQAKIPCSLMKRHPLRCQDANSMPGYGTQGRTTHCRHNCLHGFKRSFPFSPELSLYLGWEKMRRQSMGGGSWKVWIVFDLPFSWTLAKCSQGPMGGGGTMPSATPSSQVFCQRFSHRLVSSSFIFLLTDSLVSF